MRRRSEKKELVVILNDGKAGPPLKERDEKSFCPAVNIFQISMPLLLRYMQYIDQ
jgi:hypothetical protein